MPGSLVFPLMLATTTLVAAAVAWSLPRSRRLAFAGEVLLLTALFFVYFALRGITEGGMAEALAHGRRIEDLERTLHLFWEPQLQQAILDNGRLVELANLVYIWAHWPVLGATAIWLYRRNPGRYATYRNAMVISGALGVICFACYPTAPPRLASAGIEGTIGDRAGYYENFQPSFLSNEFAAVPSLHVGWSVLMGLALVLESNRRAIRAIGILMPVAMTWAVVVTGNHYFLDAAVGTAFSAGALLILLRVSPRTGTPGGRASPATSPAAG